MAVYFLDKMYQQSLVVNPNVGFIAGIRLKTFKELTLWLTHSTTRT